MDETEPEDVVTVGQRLREAREANGISIEDVAAQTRIPTRHLLSLETGDWAKLPAATYSIGFAKNYAGVIGLDRNEIGDQLRSEMGGFSSAPNINPEVYETVDPARTMPKGLVFGALILVALAVLGFTWFNNRSTAPEATVAEASNLAAPVTNQVEMAAPTQQVAGGPVVLTATDAVWIQVKDGPTMLKMGELAAGQSFEIPATAAAPLLTTGKPEALRIMVGTTQAPPVGAAGRTVSGVSLKANDLLNPAQIPAASPAASPAPSPATQQVAPAAAPASTGNSAGQE